MGTLVVRIMGSSLLVEEELDGGGAGVCGLVAGKFFREEVALRVGRGGARVDRLRYDVCDTGGALAGGVVGSGKLLTGGQRNGGLEGESSSLVVSSGLTSVVGEVSDLVGRCSKISSFVSITTEGLRSQSGDSGSMDGR